MKKIYYCICFILLVPCILFADVKPEIKEHSAIYDNDGLFISIAIINDWDAVLKEWYKPSIPDTPLIRTHTGFKRGDMMIPFITYSTDALDSQGNALITYDAILFNPDGSLYFEKKNKKIIDGVPPQGYGMYQEAWGCKIEDDDPFGEYALNIIVTDHNKSVSVEFPLKFIVIE